MDSDACYFFLRHRRRRMGGTIPDHLMLHTLNVGSPASRGTPGISWTRSLELVLCILLLLMILPAASHVDWRTRVPVDPVFLKTNSNITVREGGRAELPCTVQHLGTKQVVWRHVDADKYLTIAQQPWSPDVDVEVHHVQHNEELSDWTLVLPKVKKVDAGLYQCQLTSSAGFHTFVRLNVVGPPITEPDVVLKGTQFVERGGKIELQCNATGGKQLADAIDWFKDGNIITGERLKEYKILSTHMLEHGALVSNLQIDRARIQNGGTYVCRSSHNVLRDIVVQVLVADSSNKKRGTISSANSSNSSRSGAMETSSSPSPLCLLVGLLVYVWPLSV
ncbi:hypothetical protein EGW08_009881 [Elysia chlorotica]|uniref:Ig-like domain-containing protein n=1 Tax=Elysia chlorotica TaxID=188477 RepID=A0A3S1B8G7_ELYCH|nr:hypothetical protein EGW08_009881 [Elysia chlorotica]